MLIDAASRLELAPKKYRADHQSYFAAITRGEKRAKPVVYEQLRVEDRLREPVPSEGEPVAARPESRPSEGQVESIADKTKTRAKKHAGSRQQPKAA